MDEIVFGRYRLLSVIGQGGMGTVYRAHDTEIDRDVAIKVLPPQLANDPAYEQRFRREAYTAARLTEPHIIPIYDTGEIDGRLYLVMPIIEGTDVDALLRRDGPMSPQRAVHIVEQLAVALDAAHAAGLVHRDVKPSNALVTGRDFVYLIDFGIAHDASATKLTSTGMMVGTMAYMAPERFTAGVADARSDVYALACVLHECLTGDQPFPGNSMEQQIAGHLSLDPPRPSRIRPDLPTALDRVIATGMAKKPDERYQSAHELATAAQQALDTPSPAVAAPTRRHDPPPPPPPPRRTAPPPSAARRPSPSPTPPTSSPAPARRTTALIGAGAAIAFIAIMFGGYQLLKPLSPANQTSSAQTSSIDTSPREVPAPPLPSRPSAPATQYFKTSWGTSCQVTAQQVTCQDCVPGNVSTNVYTCPDPPPGTAVNTGGDVDHNPASIGSPSDPQRLSDGQTYHAGGWTIVVSGGWTRFINDTTGHGMAMAPQNFDSF